jgi:Yip1-like protein
MSVDHDDQPSNENSAAAKPRLSFSVEDARRHAQEAYKKSEFILSRAYGLFRDTNLEWEQIKAEETTVPNILLGYVAPLAAIPPVCGFLGALIFQPTQLGSLDRELISIVITWIVSVGLVFFVGILINAVADNFEADKNDLAAQKIAAYSLTPAFLSGFFSLWPPLWWLSLFALAAMVFLMYRGLPILMKTPQERALGYASTVTVAAAVALIIVFALSSCLPH